MAFDSNLPVLGDTGWTYRNAFCAQCNYVTKYLYWALKARCIRSAPEEVGIVKFSTIFILLTRESDKSAVTSSLRSCQLSVYHTKMEKSR